MFVLSLIIFFPVLNGLGHLRRRENKFRRFSVHAHARPNQSRIADLEVKARRLADNAHIRGDSMIHHIAGAHPGAAVALALKPTDLGLLDFTHDPGDDQVSLQTHSRFLEHLDRHHIAGESAFHVNQTASVNSVLGHDGLLRIIEMIHVRAEHQRRPASRTFEGADDIRPALLDLLVIHLHPQFFELRAEILRDGFFFTRHADDLRDAPRQVD